MPNLPVVVTGLGVLSSLGRGLQANWSALLDGRSGIDSIKRFDCTGMKTTIAGEAALEDADQDPDYGPTRFGRGLFMAEQVITEALGHAGLRAGQEPMDLMFAAPCMEAEWSQRLSLARSAGPSYAAMLSAPWEQVRDALGGSVMDTRLLRRLKTKFGFSNLPLSVTTACASGASAIQFAVEAIRRGDTRVAVAAGADGTLTPEYLVRFNLLSALSTANEAPGEASKPFSKDRDGFVYGEGAAALVLEHPEHAKARGATVLTNILGVGESGDYFHRTRSNPDGCQTIECIRKALADAGRSSQDVDYINAHGTSTPENDAMECRCITAVLGHERSRTTPVSSNKSMIGHTIAAAGVIEAAFSVMTLRTGMLPPTINYRNPDPEIPLDVVPNKARRGNPRMVLSNSFGFGGQNVCVVMGEAGSD